MSFLPSKVKVKFKEIEEEVSLIKIEYDLSIKAVYNLIFTHSTFIKLGYINFLRIPTDFLKDDIMENLKLAS